MAKRPVPLYDFKAFGQAIKAARMERKESRKDVCDAMNLSPRYLANIENKGQQPSLQIFYELVTCYSISVDQFFFPNKDAEKNTQRRQLDVLLDSMSNDGLEIITATAQKVVEVEKKHEATTPNYNNTNNFGNSSGQQTTTTTPSAPTDSVDSGDMSFDWVEGDSNFNDNPWY